MVRAVVAIDGSSIALNALEAFLRTARELKEPADVHCVSVVDYFRLPRAALEPSDVIWSEAESALSAAGERARTLGYTTLNHVVQGSVVEAILEYCRKIDATIVVIGTHGRKGVERALLGSTCDGILHRAELPVFAVHQRVGAYGGGIDGREGFSTFGSAATPAI